MDLEAHLHQHAVPGDQITWQAVWTYDLPDTVAISTTIDALSDGVRFCEVSHVPVDQFAEELGHYGRLRLAMAVSRAVTQLPLPF